MKSSFICLLFCCIAVGSGFRLKQREKRSDLGYFIKYISTQGNKEIEQTITIQNKEVMFTIEGGISAVLDYEQMLMTVKGWHNDKVCHSIRFNEEMVPLTFQQIKDALEKRTEFKMPMENITLNVRLAKDQSQPELSPLSTQLCRDLQMLVLELKPEVPTRALALSNRRPLRPKRDVGVGEVILIIIVVILLF